MPAWPMMTDQLPRPAVGDDPGRDLEEEDGGLHDGADQDELEVVEPGRPEPVEGAIVKTSVDTNAAVAAMVRNTRSGRDGRAMTASDQIDTGLSGIRGGLSWRGNVAPERRPTDLVPSTGAGRPTPCSGARLG